MTQEAINTYNEGYWYYTGSNGYPLNYNKAMEKFNMAAQMGVSLAMNYLGIIYLEGKVVKQDYSRALDWFFKAAQTEPVDIHSMYNLGRMYYNGWGVERDYETAREFLERTIAECKNMKSPYPQCCYLLGVLHLEVYKKYKEAYGFFSEAAGKGNIPEAWYFLGYLIETCIVHSSLEHLDKDAQRFERDKKARDHYEVAANMGNLAAMDSLGRLYYKYNHKDIGRQWLSKAASRGYEPAQKRLRLLNSTDKGSIFDIGSSIVNMFKN